MGRWITLLRTSEHPGWMMDAPSERNAPRRGEVVARVPRAPALEADSRTERQPGALEGSEPLGSPVVEGAIDAFRDAPLEGSGLLEAVPASVEDPHGAIAEAGSGLPMGEAMGEGGEGVLPAGASAAEHPVPAGSPSPGWAGSSPAPLRRNYGIPDMLETPFFVHEEALNRARLRRLVVKGGALLVLASMLAVLIIQGL